MPIMLAANPNTKTKSDSTIMFAARDKFGKINNAAILGAGTIMKRSKNIIPIRFKTIPMICRAFKLSPLPSLFVV